MTFKTDDGYTLYLVNGVWVDSLIPDSVDMSFSADAISGLPIEDNGDAINGEVL